MIAPKWLLTLPLGGRLASMVDARQARFVAYGGGSIWATDSSPFLSGCPCVAQGGEVILLPTEWADLFEFWRGVCVAASKQYTLKNRVTVLATATASPAMGNLPEVIRHAWVAEKIHPSKFLTTFGVSTARESFSKTLKANPYLITVRE